MPRTYYKKDDWNVICDVCGWRYKASQLMRRWDGFMVCPKDWEQRHPQDFIKVPGQVHTPVYTRPDPANQFITGVCTIIGRQAVAGLAEAGCAKAGYVDPNVFPTFNT